MTTKVEIMQVLKNNTPLIISMFLDKSDTYPKRKIDWRYGYDLDFIHGEAIGWLESNLINLFCGIFQRQPSSNEMMWIREMVQESSEEIRTTLLQRRNTYFIKLSNAEMNQNIGKTDRKT